MFYLFEEFISKHEIVATKSHQFYLVNLLQVHNLNSKLELTSFAIYFRDKIRW